MAKLTLFSAYNYVKSHGGNLFEAFNELPDIDTELLTNVLLIRGGEFGLIYPDIDFLTIQVETSVKKWAHTIERWQIATNEEYNPLHNYDRYEEYTDTEKADGNDKADGNSKSVDDTKNTDLKSAYDSSTLSTHARSEIDGTTTNETHNTSETHHGRELKHTAHLYGNIGVTTSAQMLRESRDVEKWALYENIAGLFISDWCIPIYN